MVDFFVDELCAVGLQVTVDYPKVSLRRDVVKHLQDQGGISVKGNAEVRSIFKPRSQRIGNARIDRTSIKG